MQLQTHLSIDENGFLNIEGITDIDSYGSVGSLGTQATSGF